MIPILLAGHLLTGSPEPSCGRIAELEVVQNAWGMATIKWHPINVSRSAIYVDAQLTTTTDSSEVVLSLPEGNHNIAVIPVDAEPISQIRPEYEEGDQAFLQWQGLENPDISKYLIGDDIEVINVTIKPDTLIPDGTGSGRLRVSGQFSGGTVNEDMILSVDGDKLQYAVQGITGEVLLQTGTPIQLPFGAAITPLDNIGDYHDGDLYYLPLRIDNQVLSPSLPRGEHSLPVKAVSIQGIEGLESEINVFVPAPDVSAQINLVESDGDLYVNWSLGGSHAVSLLVYSNLEVDGTLLPHINELSPTLILSGASGQTLLPYDGTSPGEIKVTASVKTSWNHAIQLLNIARMTVPVPPVVLGVPVIASITQAGINVVARVQYTYLDNDESRSVEVVATGSNYDSVMADLPAGDAGDTVSIDVVLLGSGTDGDEVEIKARTVDSLGFNFGEYSTSAFYTMIIVMPDAPASGSGVPA